MNSQTKTCQNCKKDFTIEPDDFSFYEKMKVPPPTFCPECRMIRRMNFRNERVLFRRKDLHDGKEVFSGFSPDADIVTYENKFWFGGEWNPFDTGVLYDFGKPFFEQFKSLLSKAPLPARSVINLVNSDYCNEASGIKNGYLCFGSDFAENSAYIINSSYIKDSLDLFNVFEDELCYEGVLVQKSYRTFFSFDCESCVDVWFSKGLRGCTNCFGCVNLRNKTNYFFNEACSKEVYDQKIRNINLGSYKVVSEIRKKVLDFWSRFPNKYYHGIRVVDSNGEQIYNSKDVKNSYLVRDGEHLRYCQLINSKANNSYDCLVGFMGSDNMYESVTCGMGAFNLKFCFNCWEEAQNLEYCIYCLGSKNCFGCVGLHKKQYCIFNKQYEKEEYEKLIHKIIEHMNEMPYVDNMGRIYRYGEYFPYDLSPVAYNESLAQDFSPINKQEAEEMGYIWREPKLREFDTTIDAINLPDDIKDVNDQILKEIIKCEKCSKAYKIVPMELQFYKRLGLPLPHLCIECRFQERFKLLNLPKLWHRYCMKEGCTNEFETSYSPDRPEIVYCEKCYQNEVI